VIVNSCSVPTAIELLGTQHCSWPECHEMYAHETLFIACILSYAYHFACYFSYVIIFLCHHSTYITTAFTQSSYMFIIIQYPAIPLIHYWFSCTEHFTEHLMSVRIDIPMNASNWTVTQSAQLTLGLFEYCTRQYEDRINHFLRTMFQMLPEQCQLLGHAVFNVCTNIVLTVCSY